MVARRGRWIFKRALRFLPRRAMLHRYPLIGRFATPLRRRGYLWSFRRRHLRAAYYAGSILSFLPLFGIQIPLALLAALALRSNFMVLAALQLITNPITNGPIYYMTHRLGVAVINQVHSEPITVITTDEKELAKLGGYVAESMTEPLVHPPEKVRWTERIRAAIVSMMVGGAIVGLGLAIVLDFADWLLRRPVKPATVPGVRGPPVRSDPGK